VEGGPEIEVEWQQFDRPHAWRSHSGGSLEARFACTVEPHPEGARVVSELEMIPHGFFKLLFPLLKKSFVKENEKTPEKIRTALREQYGDVKAAA
jgi:hypothetical protein